MFRAAWRFLAIVVSATTFVAIPILAQNGEQRAAEAGKGEAGKGEAPKGEAAKDAAGRIDEQLAEAARVMAGPAARGECVWLGERAVGLMRKDDLDTAFRHLKLYDRFGCPGEHVQVSFRCVVRQKIDEKDPKAFDNLVHFCWLNPVNPFPPANPPTAAVEKPGTK